MYRIPHEAKQSMRDLWNAANARLTDAEEKYLGIYPVREVQTAGGAFILKFGDMLSIGAEFEKPTGASELYRVEYPADLGDIALTRVYIDWVNDDRRGTNTVPLRNFPKVSDRLMGVL